MNTRRGFLFAVVLTAVVVLAVTGLLQQWQRSAELRGALEVARYEAEERKRLLADNARLRAAQTPPELLAALREEHAAVERLRAELEALRKQR